MAKNKVKEKIKDKIKDKAKKKGKAKAAEVEQVVEEVSEAVVEPEVAPEPEAVVEPEAAAEPEALKEEAVKKAAKEKPAKPAAKEAPKDASGFVAKVTVDGSKAFKIADAKTSFEIDKLKRADYEELLAQNIVKMQELQDRFYADGSEGLIILFQAMDAAGKDSTIRKVMSGLNPQGVTVYSFKQPSKEELAHDYLWRAYCHLPERGKIALFNRSYYEDVLVVRVHDMKKGYHMPARCKDIPEQEFFDMRFKRISEFEEHLYENGYRVMKFFLNVSLDEQKKRFLERIEDETKNWKFSGGDLDERELWPQYMAAFEDAINGTASEHAPWYVVPADQKWFARWLVSELVVRELEAINPQYPEMPAEERAKLAEYKARLEQA